MVQSVSRQHVRCLMPLFESFTAVGSCMPCRRLFQIFTWSSLGYPERCGMGLLLYAGVGWSTNAVSKAGVLLLLLPDVCGPGSYNYWIVLAQYARKPANTQRFLVPNGFERAASQSSAALILRPSPAPDPSPSLYSQEMFIDFFFFL